ncbi:MAG: glutamine synthetase [Candidatus Magasanikbacteria bacterium]|nr:glutamine synthetase [Candidatus Magasanikbacteria bacterium]
MNKIMAEYIWLDGSKPTAQLRSKTKVLDAPVGRIEDVPEWGFDGSSTQQAEGRFSDCLLKPMHLVLDPIRGEDNILVMCEVLNPDGTVHPSNNRAHLREVSKEYAFQDPWFGIEQEYTLFKNDRPAGWPVDGFPAPQGDYYCGVGVDAVTARPLVEAHMKACLNAGLKFAGINAEVMLGQWEFQIGPLPPLQMADELWLARWLLLRLGEDFGYTISLSPKPIKGDWNGAGAHTNFSTKQMRDPGGMQAIDEACKVLSLNHDKHITVYGAGNGERLTGRHETCAIDQFRYGVSDRGASIRIPMATANSRCGYLEDRRPAANADPYQVCAALLKTVCGRW